MLPNKCNRRAGDPRLIFICKRLDSTSTSREVGIDVDEPHQRRENCDVRTESGFVLVPARQFGRTRIDVDVDTHSDNGAKRVPMRRKDGFKGRRRWTAFAVARKTYHNGAGRKQAKFGTPRAAARE